MSDVKPGTLIDKVPDIPESAQKIIGHALDKAKTQLESEKMFAPFTAVLVKDQVLAEMHPGDTPQECINLARHAVEGMRGASAYAFCYDGYVDTNQGMKDAIVAEGGVPGSDEGYALAYMYTIDGTDENGSPTSISVDATPTYIGAAENFMKNLKNDSDAAIIDNTIANGEVLDQSNAEDFGEPVAAGTGDAASDGTIAKGEDLESQNAEDFGEPTA